MKTITFCVGSNCSANGNMKTSSAIKKYIKNNDLGQQFKVKFQPCSDFCDEGPLVIFNQKQLFKLTEQDIVDLINHEIEKGL